MAKGTHPQDNPTQDNPAARSSPLKDPRMLQMIARLRAEGRLILDVPIARIASDHLTRDRATLDPDELRVLAKSIFTHGQRTPVELTELPPGGKAVFGLISGWRRIQAIALLRRQTGDARFDTVLAVVRRPKDSADAYVSMVEENEVRLGLSYYERARIAAKATELGVFETEKQALLALFDSASRAKRSRIRQFLYIYRALDGLLAYPSAIGERLGLSVAAILKDKPEAASDLQAAFAEADATTADAEAEVLTKFVQADARRARGGGPSGAASKSNATLADETIGGLRLRLYQGRMVITGSAADDTLFAAVRSLLADREQ